MAWRGCILLFLLATGCRGDEVSSAPSVVAASCGNGVVEGTEHCDGTNLDRSTCELLGFTGGTLTCNTSCELVLTACESAHCGSNTIELPETCDGTALDGEDCTTHGFDGGTLVCNDTCTGFVTDGCTTCSDNEAEGDELCDGIDHNGEDCLSQGGEGGTLACNATCDGFITTGCWGCGNDRIDDSEVCDGIDLDSQDCTDHSNDGGTLACNDTCDSFVTTGCYRCGNNTVDGNDLCDGSDLDGVECDDLGTFDAGTLVCNSACDDYITTGCTECGDDDAEGDEVCDGDDHDGEDCLSLTFDGGTLACNNSCTAFVTTGCWGCGNNRLEGTETCDGSDLDDLDCTDFGTFDDGTLTCHEDCDAFVTTACTECGDGDVEGSEDCDSDGLDGEDCISQGFRDGALACDNSDCTFDEAECSTEQCTNLQDDDGDDLVDCEDPSTCQGIHPGCIAGAGVPGAPCTVHSDCAADNNDPLCESESDAGAPGGYCVEFCLLQAPACQGDGVCLDTRLPNPLSGLCHDRCNTIADCRAGQLCYHAGGVDVCLPFCTDDAQCTVLDYCNADTGDCENDDEICDNGGDDDGDTYVDCDDLDCRGFTGCTPTCPDSDLLSALGADLATGSTDTAVNENVSPCASSGAPDVELAWAAPAAGTYTISTAGSDFNTVLYVLDACGGTVLACNNDHMSRQSQVTLTLALNQPIIIVVDGFLFDSGDYALSILESEAGRCANVTDDDSDGPADCGDPDCARDPACVTCPDSDLVSATGADVATGTTTGAGPDDTTPSCGWFGTADEQLQWTAPTSGTFVFDTIGSSFDTLLYLLADDCDGLPLACNDDSGGDTTSEITLTLTAGETVIIVVDGFDVGDEGDWVLNITPP